MSSSAAEGAPTRSLPETQESQQQQQQQPAQPEGSIPSAALRSPQQNSALRRAAKRKQWTSDQPDQNHVAQLEKRKVQVEQGIFSSDQELARFGQTVADMLRRVPEEHRPQAMFDVYKLLFERQEMFKVTSKSV